MSQKRKDVTYFNVTPATSTWPIIEAQGFQLYCRGLHFSVPALSRSGRGMTIEAITSDTLVVKGLPGDDLELLKRHAEYGCLSLVCHTDGTALPFVFFPLRKRRGVIPLPAMELGYCRSIDDYVRCAGAIGRYLLRRGKPIVIADANGPIAGLPGIYTEVRGRKYFKGPHQAASRRSRRYRTRHLRPLKPAQSRIEPSDMRCKRRRVERQISAGPGISEKQRVLDETRIKPLPHQVMLFLLEGLGGIQRRANADHDRTGVGRQPARKMMLQRPRGQNHRQPRSQPFPRGHRRREFPRHRSSHRQLPGNPRPPGSLRRSRHFRLSSGRYRRPDRQSENSRLRRASSDRRYETRRHLSRAHRAGSSFRSRRRRCSPRSGHHRHRPSRSGRWLRRPRRGRRRMQSPSALRTGVPSSVSTRMIAAGKRCASKGGIRPIAPGLPSTL